MLELQLSVSQREKALALESMASQMMDTQTTRFEDSSSLLIQDIELIEEQPLDI